jgi:small subunit ribosomal protein S20
MPNTKSAKKRMRQSLVRRTRNRAAKGAIKTQVQKTRAAITAGNVQSAEAEFRLAATRLDKAATAGIIHANRAARLKSRLSAALKAAKAK